METKAVGKEIWGAYASAYEARYGVAPIRDKMANTHCKRFAEIIPRDSACATAAHYVNHNDAWYVRHAHDLRFLVQDAKKLYTELQTGKRITQTSARQEEKSSTNNDVLRGAYDKYSGKGKP